MGFISTPVARRGVLAALVGGASLLAGCVSTDSPAPGKREVLKEARESCPSERFHLVSEREVRKKPQKVEYRFETGRDLRFTVTSAIETGPLFGAYESVWSDYASQVVDIYRDGIDRELSALPGFDKERNDVVIGSFKELDEVADALAAADAVYTAEQEYNTAEWCEEYPARTLEIKWREPSDVGEPSGTDDTSDAEGASGVDEDPDRDVRIGGVESYTLTGSRDRDALLAQMQRDYAQAVADGEIPDTGEVPDDLAASTHTAELSRMTVNGREIPFDVTQDAIDSTPEDEMNPYQALYWHERRMPLRWNEEKRFYEIAIDLGESEYYHDSDNNLHESYEPGSWLVERVVRAAGGSYRVDGDTALWRIGERGGSIRMSWKAGEGATSAWKVDGAWLQTRTVHVEGGTTGFAADPFSLDDFASYFGCKASVREREGLAILEL